MIIECDFHPRRAPEPSAAPHAAAPPQRATASAGLKPPGSHVETRGWRQPGESSWNRRCSRGNGTHFWPALAQQW